MIDRQPKIKAHPGPKDAVRVKLLGIVFVSGGFGTLRSARDVRKTGVKREATLLYAVLIMALTLGHSGIALMIDRDLADAEARSGVPRQVPLPGVPHDLQPQSNPDPELRA